MALSHPSQKYPKPKVCAACPGITHERKTYHLDFDGEGTTIVSVEVFKELNKYGLETFGLHLENEVEKPPMQVVRLAGDPIAFAIPAEQEEIRHPRLHVIRRRLLGPKE
jgi:hypothetical protein